jgi:glycosyltransferase involved in cell wall biosynthesis
MAYSLAIIILTRNEQRHIERALKSIENLSKEVFLIDSFSTDETVNMARSRGAQVIQHEFVNHAKQFQWALDNAPITSEWIMRLDADEVIEPELEKEILTKLPGLGPEIVGINLRRKHIFLDRWIRYGDRYPLILLRIWRAGHGRVEDRWMDEHIVVWGGKTLTFDHDFCDYNLNDITFFIEKHNGYATREAIDVINRRLGLFKIDQSMSFNSVSWQAAAKRTIKERIYNKIPFGVGAVLYFFYRYFIRLGFLDGKEGAIYHGLQGLWYRFLVSAKIFELEKSILHLQSKEEICAELSRLTGLKIEET